MAELKNWGDGTRRAVNGLMIMWVIGTVLGVLFLLAVVVALMSQ